MASLSFLKSRALPAFSLVEMIVALGIIGLITAITLNGQTNFDKSLTVTDTAYTVALSIREAQTFGLSSRAFGSTFNAPYGIHFSASTPNTYVLFADVYPVAPGTSSSYCPGHTGAAGSPEAKPGNCLYDSAQSEVAQTFTFRRGFTLTNICGRDTGGVQRCTTGGYLTGLDILFLRPNTDSVVVGLTTTGNLKLNDVQLTLSAPSGGTRYICVTSVGEISVATTTCP
jgi:hypothetical protein